MSEGYAKESKEEEINGINGRLIAARVEEELETRIEVKMKK